MHGSGKTTCMPEPTKVDDTPATIVCPSCEREVPGDAAHCPYCCGDDGRRGAIKRGAFVGAVFGLLTGGLLAALWSSIVGPEQANGEVVVAMTLACATCGALLGAMRNRKE